MLLLACEGPGAPSDGARASPDAPLPAPSAVDTVTFHGDRARLGWNAREEALDPQAVRSARFGLLWNSPPLDAVTVRGRRYEPLIYATPLHLDAVPVTDGPFAGRLFEAVFVATSNGYVYAVNARERAPRGAPAAPGTILWRRALGAPDVVPTLDGGVPLGVLSTPFLDASAQDPRLYAVSMDAAAGWQAWALDPRSGAVLPGWPVGLNARSIAPVDRNGPALFPDARIVSQRGALNLSPDGATLYVPFGAYADGGIGFLVAVDTRSPRVAWAFAGAPSMQLQANAGIWGPGGVAVGARGELFATTGNSPEGPGDHVWGESLLRWSPHLELQGTYTPFNHCQLDRADIDLGGSSPVLLDLDPSRTSTPRLVAFGGKQGTIYLVDRERLPGGLLRRPPCSRDAASDGSLLGPSVQPQYGSRGPLNVFGPYTDDVGNLNFAKMRSTPAALRDALGDWYLYVTGSTKTAERSAENVPPSLVRLRVRTLPGAPAWLEVDRRASAVALLNPGSPVLTSNGPNNAVAWVLDENAQRTDSLLAPGIQHPVLYAFDANTLELLWRSAKNELDLAGKYGTVTVANGVVYVGTGRLQAFGLRF